MSARSSLVLHWCADCSGVRAFEVPPCEDHLECPELACIECGTAVLVGVLVEGDLAFAVSPTVVDAAAANSGEASGDASASEPGRSPWTLPRSA